MKWKRENRVVFDVGNVDYTMYCPCTESSKLNGIDL